LPQINSALKEGDKMKAIIHPASKWLLALKNSTLLFGLILGICTSVFGESPPVERWVARYNGPGNYGDQAQAVAVDNWGNVYVTGGSYGSGTNSDYATIKYSPGGNQLWLARYNGPAYYADNAQALVIDNFANVYVTGSSDGIGTSEDYATIKYSPDGNQLWVARYNGPGNDYDHAQALALDSSGNIYVTGYSTGSGTNIDYATVKYSPDGNQLWVARYNGPGNNIDVAYGIALDSSGNVYVTGYIASDGAGSDYGTIKYNSDGNQLWVRYYNGPANDNDDARAIAVDNLGNVYITGYSMDRETNWDYVTIKYSSDGNQLWVARYNGPGNSSDNAYALVIDNSGDVYVTGRSAGSGTSMDYATIKYDPNGNQLWVARYNGPGNSNDNAYALVIDNSGDVYVTGTSAGIGTSEDYATVKYSPDGNQLWVARYNGPGNSYDAVHALATDNSGNVYVTGQSVGVGADYDYATIKYKQYCIFVDVNATGENNGSSWANAYNYLQDALTAAEPNYEIWVAQGTYRPDRDTNYPGGTGNRTATFQLKNGVTIYGGFPRSGGLWTSRDPNTYGTILSGDIGTVGYKGDNSYHVVTGSGTNSTAILDGFTITAGSANGMIPISYRRGGGMYNNNGSPTVTNCTFSGNSAYYGGGMCNYLQSNPQVTNCIFNGNAASSGGGGMYVEGGISPILTGCTFTDNSANNGGGMYVSNSYVVTLTDCNFSGNDANSGGGMYNNNNSPTLTNCAFINNSASDSGGGMYNLFECSPTLTNCTFSGNDANNGGGMYTLGSSVITFGTGGSNFTSDEFYFGGNSQIQGAGDVNIGLGGEMIIDSNAVVELIDPNEPELGTIHCNGLLKVKGNGRLSFATVTVTRQADGFFGKFQVENSAQVRDVDIYTDGDRFMDVDPCTFTGIIANNRIYVTITEGQNETPEGILEVRGRDLNEPNCFDDPNVLACHLDSNAMPLFDTNSWTLERLEVAAGAKVNLVDRFSSGNGDPEVLYIKNLVFGSNCALNIGFERLYYMNLSGEPNSIKKKAMMGASLGMINCDSNEEFQSLVSNNNFTHPTDPNYNRIYVERIVGLQPDPNGMMKMHNLEDPCTGPIVFARAKGEFAPAVEDEIRIRFNYLFTTTDPGAQIVVYLSDVNELLEPNDPCRADHYIEVARIPAPPVPRAGSAGSGRFGIFDMLVSTGGLDLSKGTWIELELIEPVQGPLFKQGSYKLMAAAGSGGGTIVYVNNMSAGISCDTCQCLDLNNYCDVDSYDFLMVVGGIGSTDPPACVDIGLSTDGYLDAYDVASWDRAMDFDNLLNLCGEKVPLSRVEKFTGGGFGSFGDPLNLFNPSDLNDLLITGKRGTPDIGGMEWTKLKDRFYVFDSNCRYMRCREPEPNRYNIRIVRGVNDDLYQINSENGVLLLETGTQILCPNEVNCPSEPRYNRPAKVYVGIQKRWTSGEPDFFGRPILDAAFDAGFVYVVPVVVEPNGNEPNAYAAAAKLALDYNSTPPSYHVVKLYDGPLLPFDYNYPQSQLRYRNNLREIELDNAGNVYVTNANRINADILWKFEPNGAVHRLDLDNPNEPYYVPAPTGMCVSIATNVLYLASSIYNKTDPNSAVIRGFSTETLTPVRTIMVSKMQHVTSITENPLTHSLWITGFCFNSMPDPPDPGVLPFYDPYLAWVPLGVNNVSAVCILDVNHPDNDLAMPLSIVWTGAQPQEKCGGADLDGSGTVSLPDFAWLARYWRTKCVDSNNYSYCEMADLEPDGYIDLKDLDVLAEHWLDTSCL
jgi:uncharacterized delta-60 repeat protein